MTIGNGVTSIGFGGFAYSNNITNITFGSSLTNIDSSAFENNQCTIFDFRNATSIPTLVNVDAFAGTSSNKKIVVPDSLYDSWKAATNWSSTTNGIVNAIIRQSDYENPVNTETTFHFANGTSTTVNIQGELSTTVLENMGLKSNYQTWISQPTSVEVGSNVTSIGHNAFYNCDALTTISLPDTVTSMGDRVFFDCDNFTTINIPSQMTSIGKETFKWCKVANITLPSSIATLGQNLFASCNTLTSVTFQGKTTAQVQGMSNYSWGIRSGCVITCSNGTITI